MVRTWVKSSKVDMPSSPTSTTEPPRPPSPPEGPPNGMNFSRRNATAPFPPSPAVTLTRHWSTNRMAGASYHEDRPRAALSARSDARRRKGRPLPKGWSYPQVEGERDPEEAETVAARRPSRGRPPLDGREALDTRPASSGWNGTVRTRRCRRRTTRRWSMSDLRRAATMAATALGVWGCGQVTQTGTGEAAEPVGYVILDRTAREAGVRLDGVASDDAVLPVEVSPASHQ